MTFVLAWLLCATCVTVRCDVDNRIERIKAVNLRANYLPCGHVICDRHARFTKDGKWLCPIDGRHG